MLKYTIGFIKKGDQILLLNRESPAWMGNWNGVGGKIEAGETPLAGILREIKEETGILLTEAIYKGRVTWNVDGQREGGMYAYFAELPDTYEYPTPIKREEGILDWKNIDWILHPKNSGVANLSYFLPVLLAESAPYHHAFTYRNGHVDNFSSTLLERTSTNQL